MKKIFLLAIAVSCYVGAFAQNELQAVPTTVTETGTFVTFMLNNPDTKDQVKVADIHISYPAGWTIGKPSITASGFQDRFMWENEDEELVNAWAVGAGNVDATGFVKYSIYTNTGDPLHGDSGKFFRVKVTPPAGTPAGYYPIVVHGGPGHSFIATASAAGSERWLDTQISYVKVGEPVDATLALEGSVPSFVNEALANESAISTLDLTEVTASYGDFTYVAGRKVIAPANDVNASVKFDAPRKGAYGSFCAPVNVDVPCYVFNRAQDGFAFFTEATTAPANTPVLISQDVKTTAQTAVLKGVEGRQITSGYYVASDGSGMRSVNTSATIPALRGAWDIAASSNLRIAIETPTGIQVIGTADEVFGNTYDLKGRQTTNAKNGVFVVNGKKQFVK